MNDYNESPIDYSSKLTDSEIAGYRYISKVSGRCERKRMGCDFRIVDGPLVEMKAGVLRPKQISEMISDWERGVPARLIVIDLLEPHIHYGLMRTTKILDFKLQNVEILDEDVRLASRPPVRHFKHGVYS